jgi:hypothetical protein
MLDIVRSLLGALRATMRTHRALALETLPCGISSQRSSDGPKDGPD